MFSSDVNNNRGSNLLGVGQYNERLVIQLIRRAGSLPKAEIARMTQLSAQTVSVIINRLLKAQLLQKQPQQREKGKVGQPAMPIALNPRGAFSIGIKIGRSSLDILLIDFVGNVLQRSSHHYEYPEPDVVFVTINEAIPPIQQTLSGSERKRIVGIGVAAPSRLGGWRELTGAPQAVLERWNHINIRDKVSENQELPVWFANDATAACIAELEFGTQQHWSDFLYIFVGTFIGGGVVQKGMMNLGVSGNAGAIGSMLIPAIYSSDASDARRNSVQLIHCASLYLLNKRLKLAGFEPTTIIQQMGDPDVSAVPLQAQKIVDSWMDSATQAIAVAIANAVSVVDFKGIVIDGMLPRPLVDRLVKTIDLALAEKNMEGLIRPSIAAGSLGNDARAIGGAVLPFYQNFSPDMNILRNIGTAGVN